MIKNEAGSRGLLPRMLVRGRCAKGHIINGWGDIYSHQNGQRPSPRHKCKRCSCEEGSKRDRRNSMALGRSAGAKLTLGCSHEVIFKAPIPEYHEEIWCTRCTQQKPISGMQAWPR